MLAKCHDLRNRGEYEGALDINDRLVVDLLHAINAVRRQVTLLAPP